MSKEKVLVIDDEPDIRELLSLTLKHMNIDCDVVGTFKEGIQCIKRNTYFLVLTDMRLPDGDGYHIVQYAQQNNPNLPIAVITAYGNVEGAVNTLKAGAFDYVSKPIELPVLKNLVNTALTMNTQQPALQFELMVGETPCMHDLKQRIAKLSRSQAPVFIQGESGVGKELAAKLIHESGPRASGAFIPVNCGAIATELMESEFFGHVKGSFTGAIADKKGLFVAAEGGTLFLDEIAELPLTMQVKLLRAIQERSVRPVGALNEVAIDVRILSASNKDLLHEISEGRFRQELYYRINVIELKVPSLRDRKEDIPLLVDALVKKITSKYTQPPVTLSPESLDCLQKYNFPGNVRELENILERVVTLCDGGIVTIDDLSLPSDSPASSLELTKGLESDLPASLEQHEKDLILQALEKTKWNRTAAAKLLGVSFRVLRYRLKKLGIE